MIIAARFLSQPITGVQRFAIEMSLALIKNKNIDIQIVAPKRILDNNLIISLKVEKYGFFNSHLWDQLDLLRYLKENQNPLIVNFANTLPIFYKNKISIIHDIIFEKFPCTTSYLYRNIYHFIFPLMIENSRHIITVSEFSKKELIEFYGIKEDNISVVYNCVNKKFKKVKEEYNDKYILAVSSIAFHKNFPNIIEAFLKIKTENIKLYIIGNINKKIFGRKSLSILKNIKDNKKIKFLGYVKEEELIKFYSNAKCFVYPSIYEGFGLPPLEAQACGCPVVISNIPVFLEIYKESALFFNPFDIDDIANKIDLILNDNTLRIKLIEEGLLNSEKYSCENSAKKFLEIVRKYC